METLARHSAKFVRLAHLRRLRGCQQVAAVCYRIRGAEIEFLLVRTRGNRRWTFPKGSAEPGLTHAQAAALEAFEEAGVHGRIEEASFASYVRRKTGASGKSAASKKQTVIAHLCEVTRREAPQEFDRHPTWFSPEKAKRCLRENRGNDYAAALSRVVDRAVARVLRLRRSANTVAKARPQDSLLKVQFIDCAWRTVEATEASLSNAKPRRQFLN